MRTVSGRADGRGTSGTGCGVAAGGAGGAAGGGWGARAWDTAAGDGTDFGRLSATMAPPATTNPPRAMATNRLGRAGTLGAFATTSATNKHSNDNFRFPRTLPGAGPD